MGRHKKVTSEPKSPKCASGRRMPGSGNVKETNKSKKKGASGEGKSNGEASTGRGSVKVKTESAPAPPPPIVATSTISTSTRIITTPSRYSFPFLRSTVKKPAKVQSPPPGPSQDKSEDKDNEKVKPKAERKRWEAWSNQDKNLFFEAVAEHGKDFESIQRYIGQRHKKLGYPPNQNKNKDQVRHLYYRTCHKLLKYVTPIPNQPRVSNELFALVNYGELRKKLKGGLTAKSGLKLDELVSKGSTSIRFKGRNLKVKTPVCKALKKLKSGDKNEEKPTKLPARVLIELQPRSNAAWAEVQGVAHNPRLRLVVPLQKDIGSLLSFLSEKWTPHRLKLLHTLKPEDKSNFNQVQIHVPKGQTITPYKKLHGRFLHANTKTPFTLVSDEPVATEESPSKDAQTPPKGEVGIDIKEDLTETFLHPELDNNMEVDLLDNHHPADHMMQDTGSLPSMFGDSNSIGDLLSNMSNGSLGQTNDNLTFSNLSLSLSANPHSLAPPTNNILMHSDSMETDDAASSSVGGAGDGTVNGVSMQDSIKEEKMEVVEMEDEKKEMDVLLKEGLTAITARGITATDIFLMMGQPETLKFEYDFVKKKHSVSDVSTNHMFSKLVQLAKSSYVEAANPKQYVSVGVVTSPIRTNTPPSKSQQSSTTRSPSTSTRSPRGTGNKGNTRGTNPTTNSKTHGKSTVASKSDSNDKNEEDEEDVHFAVPKAAAPVSVRRNQEPSHAEEGQQVLNQLEQMKRPTANFLLPRMKKRQRGVKPLVVQRTILPRPLPQENVADNMLSMAIINSSQANMGHFMPIKVSMSSLGTVVSPRAVPRPIKPNVTGISTIAGVGKTITKTVIAPTPGATKTVVRRIIPVNVTNSPENRGNILHSPANFSPVHSPIMPSSPAPESQVNQVSTSQLATSPSPSAASPQPLGSSTPARGSPHMELADSSILNNTVIIDQRPATPTQPIDNMDSSRLNTPIVVDKTHQSIPNMDSTLLGDSTLDQTLTTAITMADSSLLNSSMACSVSAGQSSSSSGHSSSTTTHPTTSLNISAPEISALLDISMPASENGDNISISLDSSTFKTFGRNISATSPNSTTTELLNSSTLSRDIGNVSPTSSPFKINSLGPEAQWYNGESLDISMSSLLGHLESPEKKDKTSPSTSTAVSLAPTLSLPPGLLSESSRDSIITRDVDSTLQVMLNENSIDYIAKFADLAAHISATPDTPHKINIIEKALVEESAPTECGSPQVELSSST